MNLGVNQSYYSFHKSKHSLNTNVYVEVKHSVEMEPMGKRVEHRNFQRALQNPVLTFRTSYVNSREIWQIINVGNGAALNLQVGHKRNWDGPWIGPLVKCYSLGKTDILDIDWQMQGEVAWK